MACGAAPGRGSVGRVPAPAPPLQLRLVRRTRRDLVGAGTGRDRPRGGLPARRARGPAGTPVPACAQGVGRPAVLRPGEPLAGKAAPRPAGPGDPSLRLGAPPVRRGPRGPEGGGGRAAGGAVCPRPARHGPPRADPRSGPGASAPFALGAVAGLPGPRAGLSRRRGGRRGLLPDGAAGLDRLAGGTPPPPRPRAGRRDPLRRVDPLPRGGRPGRLCGDASPLPGGMAHAGRGAGAHAGLRSFHREAVRLGGRAARPGAGPSGAARKPARSAGGCGMRAPRRRPVGGGGGPSGGGRADRGGNQQPGACSHPKASGVTSTPQFG